MCVHHHRGDIIGRTGTQEGDTLALSLLLPTSGANTYRPLATAHTLAPVVPVCFNLFRVMIPTPQRNTGGQEDRTQENTDTGATTDRRATARPSRSCYRHRGEYLPTIGDRSHPRSCCSCMLQSLSGNNLPTPKEYRRQGRQE